MNRLALIVPAVIIALAAVGAIARPQPSWARPAPTSMIGLPPSEIRMAFSEPLDPAQCSLELKDPKGAEVALGPVTVDPTDPRRMAAPVPIRLTPGTYTVYWRAVGRDQRPAKGNYIFEVK